MPQLRVALAQVDTCVGDLTGNAGLIRRWTARAAEAGAHLVAFPEMALTGYPVEDLTLRASFVDASRAALSRLALDLAADGLGELVVVTGYLDRAADQSGNPIGVPKGFPQNAAAVLHRGTVVQKVVKHHLPNYGVFDEYRFFVPGRELSVVRVHGVDVALAICEDLWQEGGPVAAARESRAGLLLVINASPYERLKDDTRLALVTKRAAQARCPLAFVNLVGGQDDLIFDGDSLVVDTGGSVLARGPQMAEHLVVADLELAAATDGPKTTSTPTAARPQDEPSAPVVRHVVVHDEPLLAYEPQPGHIAAPLDGAAEVYEGLVLALHDYARKNGFRSVVLGLSGGIDSALVAAIAADALGPENVHGVSMPSGYSSGHSKDDAADLAKRIGLDYRVVPIAPMVDAFLAGLGLTGVAEENLQARARGVILMGLSNQEGHLVLATGNKSELAVGYSTIYGDAVGGYAPIKDVPKTLVWELARWRNLDASSRGEVPPIPENSIAKPPSAELRPGQTDQDSLPDYALLDPLLEAYVEGAQGRSELIASGFDPQMVEGIVTLVDRAEWKRRQYPPGPKISPVAFGRDRRLPITSRWREHEA